MQNSARPVAQALLMTNARSSRPRRPATLSAAFVHYERRTSRSAFTYSAWITQGEVSNEISRSGCILAGLLARFVTCPFQSASKLLNPLP
jgi:hypothetical protein